ncbi:non-hydrolyzing UDP-N-acetylglucosamine 2-epimerase [Tabrizicola sp.]|uniref:non-hydrolyzing UDP-N-acetylglucosamine 2-epimerase n=1 Tax=Tabrizicola sp. TaxID=2005166 RepID=UPI0025D013EE|nr:UDP-N-acetylglucosamine 2-epimerase (non-hydrolyzing) [Tabrizicola sp.]MBY0352436.1 UDP-N-acetylglucosamine 2-epimerase (non-hydrolyzing) [Tabrizicola sp.]
MRKLRILVMIGTRPEAIKLAPVVLALQRESAVRVTVCLSGQHPTMAHDALTSFGIAPDVELALDRAATTAGARFTGLHRAISAFLDRLPQDRIVVQGDTSTALAGALAAFHAGVPVAHVEAGLRTGNLAGPWPEEGYRRMIAPIADLHFAPTEWARQNLLAEGIAPDRVHLTGNTVVDALIGIRAAISRSADTSLRLDAWQRGLSDGKPIVLVTLHRRESHGSVLTGIAMALRDLAEEFRDHAFVLPVHPNPAVSGSIRSVLADQPNVRLLDPLGYKDFVYLMSLASLIVTDSGGVQEEAPTFGVPILVVRNESERAEAIAAGFAQLTGTDPDRILSAGRKILARGGRAELRGKANPFGDGTAAKRIAALLLSRRDAMVPTGATGEPVIVSQSGRPVKQPRFAQ